ncbi:hypothetical protein K402DRAFT_202489 [Aulographum hederae CBS 113979]|uniref:Uncharacterized protein n=1 Tax=Aulographum hederae CBS 113979 TaxID=1176131 RepID=A0A6G1HCC9_9PEZI|nr:hypothetical protein K402DRAFT_202489 [Aulographum hederae CBS 113979]
MFHSISLAFLLGANLVLANQGHEAWVQSLKNHGHQAQSLCQAYFGGEHATTVISTVYPTVTIPSFASGWPNHVISQACSNFPVLPTTVYITHTAPAATVQAPCSHLPPPVPSPPSPHPSNTASADATKSPPVEVESLPIEILPASPAPPKSSSSAIEDSTPILSPQSSVTKPMHTLSSSYWVNASSTNFPDTGTGHISGTRSISYNSTTKTMTVSLNTTVPTLSPNGSCVPEFVLDGVSEGTFNKKGDFFSVKLTCSSLKVTNATAFANWEAIDSLNITATGFSFPAFDDDHVLLSLFALDVHNIPIVASFDLYFGSIDMPVLVLGADGEPVEGVFVEADATIFAGISQSGMTNETGLFVFSNLSSTTISLLGRTSENEIGINGIAATYGLVTLQLLPLSPPTNGTSFDVNDGMTGWNGGTTVNLAKRDLDKLLNKRADTNLVLSTSGSSSVQVAHGSFTLHPSATRAYIKYKFVTDEVSGGYFGTQYNDYFSVSIRSSSGGYVSVTNSMNNLGLAAFDGAGATKWYILSLSVPPGTEYVSYDIGISNVADAKYQSQLIVDKVGDDACDKCGPNNNCENCPDNVLCQDECANPKSSCTFYRNCAEPTSECGESGYPLKYGERNCMKFTNNINRFTKQGREWITNTMHCLQVAMVPVLQTCPSCNSLRDAAFASHPDCYVNSGFCSLGCWDIAMVLATVGQDIIESWGQVGETALLCLQDPADTFGVGCAGDVLNLVATATPQTRAMAIAILVARHVLKKVIY